MYMMKVKISKPVLKHKVRIQTQSSDSTWRHHHAVRPLISSPPFCRFAVSQEWSTVALERKIGVSANH
ncbi:hypothetical protein LINGRAHAP2_LOCUS27624 [Linum grandiflorum]